MVLSDTFGATDTVRAPLSAQQYQLIPTIWLCTHSALTPHTPVRLKICFDRLCPCVFLLGHVVLDRANLSLKLEGDGVLLLVVFHWRKTC